MFCVLIGRDIAILCSDWLKACSSVFLLDERLQYCVPICYTVFQLAERLHSVFWMKVYLITIYSEESLRSDSVKEAPVGKKARLIVLLDLLHMVADILQVSVGVNLQCH